VFLSVKGHFQGKDGMKKYGILDNVIKKEFKTLGIFSRESTIPKATLSMLINGKYGSDETKVMKKVGDELKKLRPDLDLDHIWDPTFAWYQKYLLEKSIVKNGFRIVIDVKLNEKGELAIAPFVEGY
jgi:hypothetical protein